MGLTELTEISRFYGSAPGYVIAGGGNTSFKDRDTLYIKGSGTSLNTNEPEGFVKMDRGKLALIWEKNYGENPEERERAVLADMMAARRPGEENKRPSVETLLHDILPFEYVVHTHPSLVNGLCCSKNGEAKAADFFGDDAIWIPSCNPGYVLCALVKTSLDAYRSRTGKEAALIFLQNHGVFVGADSTDGIKAIYGRIMGVLEKHIKEKPDFSGKVTEYANSAEIAALLARLAGGNSVAVFERNNEFARLAEDASSFYPVSSALTPDHIVYSGSDPLFIGAADLSSASGPETLWKGHLEKIGRVPKIAAVQGLGVFGIGDSEKAARLALSLFTDTARVSKYADSFGGALFMTRDKIDFINNWEVERYRSKIAASQNS
ncbi:MAG: class II aldolase/adducin family protein [Spirochaetaceae bacterium]|jgi:rhamnose utilization protein RhaD (predicted bifunctional aldolase and dehydrogenase)|nr:class II aldolase/adducin family protein [Spirochaetaceae bacterium]